MGPDDDETKTSETPADQEPAATTPEGDVEKTEPTDPAEGDAGAADGA